MCTCASLVSVHHPPYSDAVYIERLCTITLRDLHVYTLPRVLYCPWSDSTLTTDFSVLYFNAPEGGEQGAPPPPLITTSNEQH